MIPTVEEIAGFNMLLKARTHGNTLHLTNALEPLHSGGNEFTPFQFEFSHDDEELFFEERQSGDIIALVFPAFPLHLAGLIADNDKPEISLDIVQYGAPDNVLAHFDFEAVRAVYRFQPATNSKIFMRVK